MKKLVAVVLFIGMLSLGYVPAYASGYHSKPGGGQCNNTQRHWYELGMVDHGSGSHYSGDKLCIITYYRIGHDKKCTSCHHVFVYNSVWECTQYHTSCGNGTVKDCADNFDE